MFNINLAGLVIRVDNRYPFLERMCKKYISDGENADFSVRASDESLEKEKKLSAGFSDEYIESLCVYREICLKLPEYDAMLMHSCVVSDGDAYAFVGRSGAGKSTHARLWKNMLGDKITYINGDKPILRRIYGCIYAFGTPWAGKERLETNTFAPLRGLCFVNQAKENRIVREKPGDAAVLLMKQILIPKERRSAEKTLDLLSLLVDTVPAWSLYCDISPEAAKLSYTEMTRATGDI